MANHLPLSTSYPPKLLKGVVEVLKDLTESPYHVKGGNDGNDAIADFAKCHLRRVENYLMAALINRRLPLRWSLAMLVALWLYREAL